MPDTSNKPLVTFTCQNDKCNAEITAWEDARGCCPFCGEPYYVMQKSNAGASAVIVWGDKKCVVCDGTGFYRPMGDPLNPLPIQPCKCKE